jgi:hypothetical protein
LDGDRRKKPSCDENDRVHVRDQAGLLHLKL